MDRLALSKRLEGLSTVFAGDTRMHTDLKAMSYVLANMKDEDYKKVLSSDYQADERMEVEAIGEGQFTPGQARPKATRPSDVWKGRPPASGKPVTQEAITKAIIKMTEQMTGKPVTPGFKNELEDALYKLEPTELTPEQMERARKTPPPPGLQKFSDQEDTMGAEASDSSEGLGNYWNKEASKAVINGLLRDVVGMDKTRILETNRKLTPNQTPDGKHEGVPEKPKTLKPEQTPDQADVLESDMYAQSNKTPLRKTAKKEKAAGSEKGPGKPDGTGPYGGTAECPMSEESKGEEGSSGSEEDPLDKIMAKVNRGIELSTTERKALSAALDASKKAKGEKSAGALEEMKEQKAKGKEQKAEKLEEEAKKHSEESAKKLERAEDIEEEAEKAEEEAEQAEEKKEKKKKPEEEKDVESSEGPTTIVAEGIELTPSMDEVSLDDEEAQKLSKLFE